MPVPDFFFSLEFSDKASFSRMIDDLSSSVLRHAGFGPDAVADIAASLGAAIDRAAASGSDRCQVEFTAHGGELRMAVACGGAGDWRESRPLPR